MTGYIDATETDGYLHWHINRPDRFNALGTTLAKEFETLIAQCQKHLKGPRRSYLRGLILSAETVRKPHGHFWIAGGDLKELALLKHKAAIKAYAQSFSRISRFFETCPLPVIALMDGLAIGGGAELALAADMRIGTKQCGFQFKQLSVGLATGYGGGKRLVDIAGRGLAQQYLYTGRTITAEEAYRAGLLTHLWDDLDAGLLHAKEFLNGVDASSFAAQKAMLLHATKGEQAAFYAHEEALFLTLWGNETHRRTLQKFK